MIVRDDPGKKIDIEVEIDHFGVEITTFTKSVETGEWEVASLRLTPSEAIGLANKILGLDGPVPF